MIRNSTLNKEYLITSVLIGLLIITGIWAFLGARGVSGPVQEVNKIALPAEGSSMDDLISEYFGRTRYFIVYDIEKKVFWPLSNPFYQETHAAGLRVGAMLVNKGVSAIVCKNIGPEPIKKFNDSGIKVYIGAQGTVADGIKQYENNQLILTTRPNVPTHYGLPGQSPCPNILGQPKTEVENPMKQVASSFGGQAYTPGLNGTIVCPNCGRCGVPHCFYCRFLMEWFPAKNLYCCPGCRRVGQALCPGCGIAMCPSGLPQTPTQPVALPCPGTCPGCPLGVSPSPGRPVVALSSRQGPNR